MDKIFWTPKNVVLFSLKLKRGNLIWFVWNPRGPCVVIPSEHQRTRYSGAETRAAYAHMPSWEFSAQVWHLQNKAGRLVLLEQPLLSAALRLPCMSSRDNVHRAVVDQCMFELKDPVTLELYRKRTVLDVNSPVLAAPLTKGSKCSRHPCHHEIIEGKTGMDGKRVNRSLVEGTWTPAFGRRILADLSQCWWMAASSLRASVFFHSSR